MLNVKTVRGVFAQGLKASTSATAVIQSEGGGDKPKYPYIEYKMTNVGTKIGQAAEYMKGTKLIHEQDRELVVSITCYGVTKDSATDLAYEAVQYFDFTGIETLQDNNIVVVECTTLTDRTTLLTTDFEHRIGFDVRLRVRTQAQKEVDYIESVTLKHDIDL